MVNNIINTKEKGFAMNYSISDFGNVCSILGFILTIITFIVAADVNSKINKMQKSKKDISYFNKKVESMIKDLNDMKSFAESSADINKIFGLQQQSKIKNAITVIKESWDVLLPHENIIIKKYKVHSWNKKMKKILKMYMEKKSKTKNQNELLSFLIELITFLEKENENNE